MMFIAASSSFTSARESVEEDRFQHSVNTAFLFNQTNFGLSGDKPVDEAIMEEVVENNTYPKSTMEGTEIRASDDGEGTTTKSSAGCETVSKINNYMPLYLSLVVVESAAVVLLTALVVLVKCLLVKTRASLLLYCCSDLYKFLLLVSDLFCKFLHFYA